MKIIDSVRRGAKAYIEAAKGVSEASLPTKLLIGMVGALALVEGPVLGHTTKAHHTSLMQHS